MKPRLLLALVGVTSVLSGQSLEFLAPADRASFAVGTEIPLVLRGQIPDGVVAAAAVFVDGWPVGTAVYCCHLCPCAFPTAGMELVLQLPAPWDGSFPANPWIGLRGLAPGTYRLTATATVGLTGLLEAPAVTVTVLATRPESDLHMIQGSDGRLLFVLPEGSLEPGGVDLWLSHDLTDWHRLGPFDPGNLAAFFADTPDPADPRPRFYRALPALTTGLTESGGR